MKRPLALPCEPYLREDRPRWARDVLAHAKYFRLRGYRGKRLKKRLSRVAIREDEWLTHVQGLPPRIQTRSDASIDLAWVLGLSGSDAVQRLSYSDRAALYLIHHHGRTRAAEILGTHKATLQRHLKRIKESLPCR